VVEPEIDSYEVDNILGFIDNPLVITKTYSIKWQRDQVDLVELAKNRWINQMSQREIAKKMGITRGQVDWNLKKFKKAISELSDSADLVEVLKKIKEEESK
jgi:predicted DNA-binding protein YlxM (UPF0122 family)